MIKVCHVANLITGAADGVFNHLKMIFQNYNNSQFEHFIIFQGGEFIESELSNLNIKYYVVESPADKFSLVALRKLYSIIKTEKPIIIHTHLIKPYILIGIINFLLKKKTIFNHHGYFIQNDYNTRFEKSLYILFHKLIEFLNPTDLVLVPSSKNKEMLEVETKAFRKIESYYNGFDSKENYTVQDNSLIQQINDLKKQGKKLICSVGRINREKRFDKAIVISKALTDKEINFHLFVIGEGEKKGELKELAKKHNLDNQITFPGYVKNSWSYLKFFDLLLITSDREGMPFILWEALGSSLPVVSSDVGGIKEIIEVHNCGYTYEKDNLNDAVQKISLLLREESLRKSLGYNGLKIVTDKFNPKNFINRIEGLYYSLAKAKNEIRQN